MGKLASAAGAVVIFLGLAGDVRVARATPPPNFGRISDEFPTSTYKGRSAHWWARRYRQRTHQLYVARTHLRRKWRPTVLYAIKLASRVAGVSYREMRQVSWCESRYDAFAVNGRYHGIFQLGWSPFGFSAYDPVANALSAALTVKHDGSWRQWECKP